MTLPANIRVNTQVPFPALVTGTGPIAISKNNGIWTVAFNPLAFPAQNPLVGNYPTDVLFGYDSINKALFSISITNLISSLNIVAGSARAQRAVVAGPVTATPGDQIINCNIAANTTGTLPSAAARLGVPITVKNINATHNIVWSGSGGDLIDGLSTYTLNSGNTSVTFNPFNDTVNSGWEVL